MNQTKSHDYRIDRLRLLACFGVVLLHSSFGEDPWDLALNAFARFCVPVFVMISGYFMLERPLPLRRILQKTGSLLGKMLLWSGIYLLYSCAAEGYRPQSIPVYLLTEPVHLWYLYATMGLYLMTPILHVFVRSADEREFGYALGFCFAMGCCVTMLVRLNLIPVAAVILDKTKLPSMLGFVFLYLMGGYFRKFGIRHKKGWLAAGAACSLFSMAYAVLTRKSELLSFLAPNVAVPAAACFAVYMTRSPVREKHRKWLRSAAGCTMGVYLIHVMVSAVLTPLMQPLLSVMFPVGAVLVRAAGIFGVSFAAAAVLGKIPVVRRILL